MLSSTVITSSVWATQSTVSVACRATRQERRLKSTVRITATATAALAHRRNRASVSGSSLSLSNCTWSTTASLLICFYAITAVNEESGHDYQRADYDPGEVNLAQQGIRDVPN